MGRLATVQRCQTYSDNYLWLGKRLEDGFYYQIGLLSENLYRPEVEYLSLCGERSWVLH